MNARLAGAAPLAAALLLLAPDEARADGECGAVPSGGGTITCSGATYADGIEYENTAVLPGNDAFTVNIPGSSSATTTVTVKAAASGFGTQGVAVRVVKNWGSGAGLPRPALTVNVGGETGGTAHVVNIRQGGATWVVGGHQDNGIQIENAGIGSSTTLNVRRGVTIGTRSVPMERAGINLWLDVNPLTGGGAFHSRGAGAVSVTNEAPIFARTAGIKVHRASGGAVEATTIVNRGAISAGVGNAADTSAEVDQPHGINLIAAGSQARTNHNGAAKITNTGAITVSGAYAGVRMKYNLYGAAEIDNAGDIAAPLGRGIQFDYDVAGSGAIALTNSGDIGAATYGVRIRKNAGSGAVALTNSGDVTATAAAAPGEGHALYLIEEAGVTGGAVTIANSGVLRSKNHALFAFMAATATSADSLTLTNSGDVASEDGDGIRIDRANSAFISVTVAEGGSVSGGVAGVRVSGAATDEVLTVARKYLPLFSMDDEDPELLSAVTLGEGADAVNPIAQLITVAGAVTGGTEAAVVLSGGGGLLVLEGGQVRAGSSGVAVLADGPALVYIDGEVRGAAAGAGAARSSHDGSAAVRLTGGGHVTIGPNGRVLAAGADYAIQGGEDAPVTVTAIVDREIDFREDALEHVRVTGRYRNVESVVFREDRDGVPTGYTLTLPVGEDGRLDASELPARPTLSCAEAGDRRCRMYEALPSMLLALNAPASRADRASAARDANGGWARIEASSGQWRAKQATTAGALAYDHRWIVARAGVDVALRDNLLAGVSVHAPRGDATVAGVGDVDLTGVGAGVSALWTAGEMWVDAGAAATRYEVDLASHRHGRLLAEDAVGVGWALSVEAGRRMAAGERLRRFLGEAFVTPRAGLAWSSVALRDFTDMETTGEVRSRVSMKDARSAKASVGATVETAAKLGDASGRLFGSLDVERELSDETTVEIVGERTERLETTVRPTALSLGVGAAFDAGENALVTATAGWRASGGGSAAWSGALQLRLQF